MYPIKQSTAITVPFYVHDASGDAVTSLTDGSFTKRISKNGAAFGAMTVTISEMENGWYSIPLSTSHSDTLGLLCITFTNAGAKQVNLQFRVHARIPDDLAYPTTTGRSIDVTTGGAVGIDWANVENPTTAVDLSATDIQLADTVTTLTGHTVQTGDSFARIGATGSGLTSLAQASVLGALADAAAAGDPTVSDTVVAYVKQLINTLEGAAGIPTFPAEAAPGNAVSLAEIIRAIHTDVTGLNGDAMRGTDNAALASVLGALADAAAAGDPTSADTLMQYVKQLVNLLAGTAGIATMPAAADPANGVNLFEMLRAAMGATFSTSTDSLEELRADIRGVMPVQNAVFNNIEFLFVAASDHVTPVTGATGTAVTRSIDGAAFGSGTGTLAEVGNGVYQYDASAADMNGKVITFRFTGTGGTPGAPDDVFLTIVTDGGA